MALRACLLEASLSGLVNHWTPALLRVAQWKNYSPWPAKGVFSFGSNKSIIITRVYCYQSRLDDKKDGSHTASSYAWACYSHTNAIHTQTHTHTHISFSV